MEGNKENLIFRTDISAIWEKTASIFGSFYVQKFVTWNMLDGFHLINKIKTEQKPASICHFIQCLFNLL